MEATETVDDEVESVDEEESFTLLRMTRGNPTFEIVCPSGNRYIFRSSQPFALVKDDDDVDFIKAQGGFELATPNQYQSFFDD